MTGIILNNISDCYIGNNQVNSIWMGSTKIWPTAPHDYSQDYFTLEVIDNGTLQFYTHGRINGSEDRITLIGYLLQKHRMTNQTHMGTNILILAM